MPTGAFSVQVLTGEREATYYSDFYATCFDTHDLASLVPNYHASGTDNDRFVLGVEGFDIYARYNGYEFLRFREYRHMEEGRVALRAAQGYGFRRTTVRHRETPKPLLSDYQNLVFDLRDFGLRSIKATGSIAAGSTELRLTAPPLPAFEKGDFVIVETGGEAGRGLRGTLGVGGSWPGKHYADAGARDQDTSQPVNTYAWLESDGFVHQWTGSAWVPNAYWVNTSISPPVIW